LLVDCLVVWLIEVASLNLQTINIPKIYKEVQN